jgi:hypothetical protein
MSTVYRSALAIVAMLVGIVVVLPVAAVALVFAAVASVTRMVGAVHLRARASPWRDLVEYEPVIGWKPRANLSADAQADDVFHLTTGPDGWRGKLPLKDADVVVFGDSFAFGHGAADDAMYTRFCGNLRVKPVGSDGYDMVHGLLWMQRLHRELFGKVVVWFVYYGNDLHENLVPNSGRYRKPYVRQRRDGKWEVVSDHVSPEPWPLPSPSSYHRILASLCCPMPFSQRVFSACAHLLTEAHTLCAGVGARLAVVGIPDRVQLTRRGRAKLAALAPTGAAFDIGRPDRELSAICRRLGLAFVPLREHLTARHYLVHDIHWRRAGHRKVGAVVRRLHEQVTRPSSAPGTLSPLAVVSSIDIAAAAGDTAVMALATPCSTNARAGTVKR